MYACTGVRCVEGGVYNVWRVIFGGRNFRIPTLDRARGVCSRAGWPHPSIQRIARARFGWDHDSHLSWDVYNDTWTSSGET